MYDNNENDQKQESRSIQKIQLAPEHLKDILPHHNTNEEQQLERVFFVVDTEGKIQYVNPVFFNHSCFASKTYTKESLLQLVHPEDVNPTVEYLIQLIQGQLSDTVIEHRICGAAAGI